MEFLKVNPWADIFLHPKKTMRGILDWNPKKIIIWLAFLGGIVGAIVWLGQSAYKPQEQRIDHHFWFIVVVLIFGALLGFINLYFSGWLYQLTGSWVGGKGTFVEVKCAVGWSNYPFILANLFNILTLLATHILWLKIIFAFINAIFVIWAFVIYLHLLAEVHRFSIWKALLAVIIGVFLVFVALMLISLIIPLVAPLFSSN